MGCSVAPWSTAEESANFVVLIVVDGDVLRAKVLATSLFLLVGFLVLLALALFIRWLRRVTRPRPPVGPSKYLPADDWYQKPLVPPVAPSEGASDQDSSP